MPDRVSVHTYECMSALTALLPFYVPSDIVMCCNVDNNGEMVQRSFGHASKNQRKPYTVKSKEDQQHLEKLLIKNTQRENATGTL